MDCMADDACIMRGVWSREGELLFCQSRLKKRLSSRGQRKSALSRRKSVDFQKCVVIRFYLPLHARQTVNDIFLGDGSTGEPCNASRAIHPKQGKGFLN